jgi:putative ABC transport system permease protein
VLGREPSAAAQRALSTGGAVSLYPEYIDDGKFSVSWWTPRQVWQLYTNQKAGTPVKTETVPAVVDKPAHPTRFGVFISSATAKKLGLEYRQTMVIASTSVIPTTPQQDSLRQAISALPDLNTSSKNDLYSDIELGPQNFSGPLVWGLLGLAGLIAIASSAVAIGLARFDGRQDDATLAALGAGRVLRKNFAFWQAIIIAGLGSVLGAATGLVPAWALASADLPFVPPWLQIGLVVIALPVLIACGSWLLSTRNKTPARRVAIA